MFAVQKNRRGKRVSESAICGERIPLFSQDIHPHEVIFGGRILEIVDSYAKIVAERHAEISCKASRIDSVRFFSLTKRGDILICYVCVNKAWRFSMEVGVKVIAEDFRSLEKKHILSAYFTFETETKEQALPYAICETKEQKRRFLEAEKRRIRTLKIKNIFFE